MEPHSPGALGWLSLAQADMGEEVLRQMVSATCTGALGTYMQTGTSEQGVTKTHFEYKWEPNGHPGQMNTTHNPGHALLCLGQDRTQTKLTGELCQFLSWQESMPPTSDCSEITVTKY